MLRSWPLIAVLLFAAVRAADETPQAEEAKLNALAGQLGSDAYAQRIEAENALMAAPLRALPVLRAVLKRTHDLEARHRLRRVVSVLAWEDFQLQPAATEKLSFNFQDAPLRDVFASPALKSLRQYGPDIFPTALGTAAFTPITLRATNMEARNALRWFARLAELRREVRCSTERHDVSGIKFSAEELAEMLPRILTPGKEHDEDPLVLTDGRKTLIATAPVHMQKRIALIVDLLRRNADAQEIVIPRAEGFDEAPVLDLMQKKVTFDFTDEPLMKVIAFLQQHTDASLVMDRELLGEETEQIQITLRATDMSVELALKWALKAADLKCWVTHGAMLISPGNGANTEHRIYNVDDMLLLPGLDMTVTNAADLIRNRACPESWDAALGTFLQEQAGVLVVVNTPEVHAEIGKLLKNQRRWRAQIRAVEKDGKQPETPLPPEKVPLYVEQRPPEPEWKKAITEKLKKPVTFNWEDKPLADGLAELSKASGVNMVLDPRLFAEGADKTPVTLRVAEMECDQAFEWVLRLAELKLELRDEACFVTKKSNLTMRFDLEVYYARDLETQIQGSELRSWIATRFFVGEFAEPSSSIEDYNGLLVVMQTPEMHARIRQFLTRLRTNKSGIVFPFRAEKQEPKGAAHEETARKLASVKVTCAYKAATLSDVAADLQKQTGMPVILDPALKDSAATVTCKAGPLDVESMLIQLLRHTGAAWKIEGGNLCICPAADVLEIALYSFKHCEDDEMLQKLTDEFKAIEPEQWNNGAEIERFGTFLFIRQSAAMHTLIAKRYEESVKAAKK